MGATSAKLGFAGGQCLTNVILTDDASYGCVGGNKRSGAVATKMGELDGLEAHGDFLIYNWPETNVTGSHLHSRRLGRSPELREV